MDKKSLRQEIRRRKKEHTPEELMAQSERIMMKLAAHPAFVAAERVMLYASLPDEVQTMDFIDTWKKSKRIILPTVAGDDIIPVEATDESEMQEGDFHILEPKNKPYVGSLDLIVVPGMAFDRDGHRLGRGRGYYDRFLAAYPHIYKIGVCFDFQKVEEVPTDDFDIAVDEVI